MDKLDFKKAYKDLYLPKSVPGFVTVPAINFIIIDGKGNPNGEEFAIATAALYSLSYAVKMSYKSDSVPAGYYDYIVFPLEGVWDLIDKSKLSTDKDNYKYKIMIRQPDFLTAGLFEQFLEATKKKKPNPYLDRAEFSTASEELCVQMMHTGSYDDEPASFEMMHQFCQGNGYKKASETHREIYLSDPRKTASEKLKTVLRYPIERIG